MIVDDLILIAGLVAAAYLGCVFGRKVTAATPARWLWLLRLVFLTAAISWPAYLMLYGGN